MGLEVDNLNEFIQEVEGKGFKIPLRDGIFQPQRSGLASPDAAGVVLQITAVEQAGSDATIEDRIDRIRKLQNQSDGK